MKISVITNQKQLDKNSKIPDKALSRLLNIKEDVQLGIRILPPDTTVIVSGSPVVFTINVFDQSSQQPVDSASVFVTDTLNHFSDYLPMTTGEGIATYTFMTTENLPEGVYYIDFEASAPGYINSDAERRFVRIQPASGVNDEALTAIEPSVTISPNPASDVCNVSLTLGQPSSVTTAVYDILGNEKLTAHTEAQQGLTVIPLSVGDMAAGQYFIRLTFNGQTINRPLVINR